jgi:signal transduction histidine kinase
VKGCTIGDDQVPKRNSDAADRGQDKLRSLLNARRVISGDLDLPSVLRRIVEAAIEMVGASYGAIGVVGANGSLEQLIHVGIPDKEVQLIGRQPEGHGVLGVVMNEQVAVRLDHVSAHPQFEGFPEHHPHMESFLGVPVRVRDEVYGNLYLADQKTGHFSKEDEELVLALAATAGAAIDNARLYDESQRRLRWSEASAEVTATLLSNQVEDALAVIVDRVAVLAEADLAHIALPISGTRMRIEVARGPLADTYNGLVFDAAGTAIERAYESGEAMLSEVILESSINPSLHFGAMMAIPLTSPEAPAGILVAARLEGRPRFTPADLEMASDFAAQASVALRLVTGARDRERLAVLEERARIARDLHDHVIQRLFGAGLELQAIAGATTRSLERVRITEQVDALDAAIAEIRTIIFAMKTERNASSTSIRHRIFELLGESSWLAGTSPTLRFFGPIDLLVPGELTDDLLAVIRESLANVAKHARATRTSIDISAVDGRLTVQIEDNGTGFEIEKVTTSSGIANLAERAHARGGDFTLTSSPSAGTVLVWSVPLVTEAAPS